MTIRVTCRCGQSFAARPEHRGHTLPCPACRQPLTIPQDDLFDELPTAAPPISKSLPSAHGRASGGSQKLTLLLAIGGGVAIFLLMSCGVIGVIVYKGYSKAREVAAFENSVIEELIPLDKLQQQAAESSKDVQKLLGKPGEAPPASNGPANDLARLITQFGLRPHVVPGLFSISANPDLVWEDFPKEVIQKGGPSGSLSHISTAKKPGEKVGDIVSLQIYDIPNASQRYRLANVQAQQAYLVPFNSLHRMRGLKGLEVTGEPIPDVVNFSYEFEVGDDYGYGAGKIIFSHKRISVLSGRVFNRKDSRVLEATLASYAEQ